MQVLQQGLTKPEEAEVAADAPSEAVAEEAAPVVEEAPLDPREARRRAELAELRN